MFRVIHPNRWFFWTVSLLFIIGLGLLAYIEQSIQELSERSTALTQPASESVSDPSYFGWKVYRSTALGFAVKYPPSWQIEVDPLDSSTINLENPKNFNENIAVSRVSPKLEKLIRDSLAIASETDIVLDSYPGVWIKSRDTSDKATSNVILVKKDGRLYSIAGSARAFEKIIAGFRFLSTK